jgi:hypothetical protein
MPQEPFNHRSTSRPFFHRESTGAPLEDSFVQSRRAKAPLREHLDRLHGQDAVGPAAVGDHKRLSISLSGTENAPGPLLLGRPNVK